MPQHGDVWTVLTMLEWGTGYFDEKGITQPRLSIEWLLADVLHCKRLDLYLTFDRPLSNTELEKLRGMVKRRARHEPLQYITGSTDFYNCRIEVNPSVLIPRPETEQLVELAIGEGQKLAEKKRKEQQQQQKQQQQEEEEKEQAKEQGQVQIQGQSKTTASEKAQIPEHGQIPKQAYTARSATSGPVRVLDAGTGSGCIAIAIKKAMPEWDVTAIDISKEALETARRNAALNATGITFALCDFFDSGLGGLGQNNPGERFDLIVSNPPYIRQDERNSIEKEVYQFEPEAALFHDDVPGVYNALRLLGERWLAAGGMLIAELNEFRAEEFLSVFAAPVWQAEILRDYSLKDRFVRARLM